MTILLILPLLCISTLAQKPTHYPQNNQIYAPFAPPISQQHQSNSQTIKDFDSQQNGQYVPSDQKKQQYQQFNEMFAFGILAGSALLAFTLVRTCKVQPTVRRLPAVHLTNPSYQIHPHLNQPRVLSSFEIQNQICNHKKEIKRLKKLVKQAQEYERQIQQSRRQQTIKAYHMELQQKIAPQHYNIYQQSYGQVHYGKQQAFQRQEFIPIGRPLTQDNDSYFASEYPNL